jgi:hypothetical protein
MTLPGLMEPGEAWGLEAFKERVLGRFAISAQELEHECAVAFEHSQSLPIPRIAGSGGGSEAAKL